MLKLSTDGHSLIRLGASSLVEASVLERHDLQRAIVHSWAAFRAELGFEELYLVGEEVEPHHACQDRIDVLALDGNGHPVIIELKRGRDKFQLLQAISYAGMVAKWDARRFLDELREDGGDDELEDLKDLLRGEGFELRSPKIVLIAEMFDPEVILAADWLARSDIDITAFAISVVEHAGDVLISIDQRFPILGIDDAYERRGRRNRVTDTDDAAWETVLPELRYPFAKRALELFRSIKAGDPGRRRFTSMFSESPFGGVLINFRRNYLTVYTREQTPELEAKLKQALGPGVDVVPWGSEQTRNKGYTFKLQTEEQFDRFLHAVGIRLAATG